METPPTDLKNVMDLFHEIMRETPADITAPVSLHAFVPSMKGPWCKECNQMKDEGCHKENAP